MILIWKVRISSSLLLHWIHRMLWFILTGYFILGACGGSCACSTCHIIVDPEYYDLIEEPDDDENDMLDLAFGLTET